MDKFSILSHAVNFLSDIFLLGMKLRYQALFLCFFPDLQTSGIPLGELREHLFMLRDNDASQHLFQVASGLDSLVLGEGQILAQVKQVHKVGQGVLGFERNIGGLFKHAITAGK